MAADGVSLDGYDDVESRRQ